MFCLSSMVCRLRDPRLIRLVLADDHALVLDGLRALLSREPDLRVVATATDGERLLDAVRRFKPDLAVIDIQMPYMDGLTCLRQLRAEGLPVRVLILTAFGSPEVLRSAMEAGADGLALKTDSTEMTLAAIRQVAHGQMVFPQSARQWLTRPAAPDPDTPTEREEIIWAQVAEGKSNTQIAAELHLSESTIKFHLRHLFAKLGVSNRNEAAAHYHRRGADRRRG